MERNRPKNLNLMSIRLPINALVSILHRISGVILYLTLPLVLLGIQMSLKSADNYQHLTDLLDSPLIKCMLIGFAWAFFHHFFAGIRHLAMDVHWMTSLQKARFSGRVVLWLGAIAVAIFTSVIW